jgi:aryl-alcohol dehydrogenase-like predicted oxidoreductase
MEYVDLYMIHWPLHPKSIRFFTKDPAVVQEPPVLADAVQTLIELQKQGKIRHLALSNFGVPKVEEISGIGGEYVADQLGYSLLTRAPEMEILPYCEQHKIGVIAYMVLMQGLLSDRFATFDDMPDWYTRTRHFNCQRTTLCRHGEEGAEEETIQALKDIRAIAKECGLSITDLAFKWAVANHRITCVLVGTQSVERLSMNARAVEEPLPGELLDRLNQVTQPLKEKLGPSLDLFESVENDRTR